MKRHGSRAQALKHPHDLDAESEQEWNILREECFTPASVSRQCHGFRGTGLNEGNGLAGIYSANNLILYANAPNEVLEAKPTFAMTLTWWHHHSAVTWISMSFKTSKIVGKWTCRHELC